MADANRTPVKRANLFVRPFLVKGKGKLSTAEASRPRDKVGGFLSLIEGGIQRRAVSKREMAPSLQPQQSKHDAAKQ
jgi:hypothetical protein